MVRNIEHRQHSQETSAKRTDADIRRDVLDELEWERRVQPSEIGVSVNEGIVTLSGTIDSYPKRWAAEEASFRVLGVKAVVNELEVQLPRNAEHADEGIAEAALAAFAWDADLHNAGLTVTVSHGWVALHGEVEVQFQREEAERLVRRLAGVRGVTNGLTIRRSSPAPEDVAQRIERALLRNAETDAQRIHVQVHGHRATLRGIVASWAERRAAEGSAWSAPGITEVDDQLVIAPVPSW